MYNYQYLYIYTYTYSGYINIYYQVIHIYIYIYDVNIIINIYTSTYTSRDLTRRQATLGPIRDESQRLSDALAEEQRSRQLQDLRREAWRSNDGDLKMYHMVLSV